MRPIALLAWIYILTAPPVDSFQPAPKVTLPLKQNSVRFAVIGDNGTGGKAQYQVAEQMSRYRELVEYEFVLMLGDNIYGSESESAMRKKFEIPYKPLLDAGVKFYASLGNHDNLNQRFYKPFNMGGQRYYTFKKGSVQFFALDSNYMNPVQLSWLRDQLSSSTATWKICFFHHPLYAHARFHGPDLDLRAILGPVLEVNGVDVVMSGHEHVYERLKPQNGIYYFVVGNSGELRRGNLMRSPEIAAGFDTDCAFMLAEIDGDEFHFQTISRTGETVDSGVLLKQSRNTAARDYLTQGATLAAAAD